jgi:hypothetical protein
MKLLLDSKTAIADQEAFSALPDYSASLPTGTNEGKRWKRRIDYHDESKGWMMGEYVKPIDPEMAEEFMFVKWRTLLVVI